MIDIRPFNSLGHADHGWLDARHHFSFASYHDPARMGWGRIRVWNDDRIAGKSGFPPHPHRDMEIVTWVLAGSLVHQDSTGHAGVIYPGLAQRMSAGTGILHSEKNDAWRVEPARRSDEPVRFVQMWVLPDEAGATPGYEQLEIDDALLRGGLVPVASGMPQHESAIRIGNPASWELALQARDESNGYFGAIDDDKILEAQRILSAEVGIFVEPASAISVAGLLERSAAGAVPAGARVVLTVTGHGLKDPAAADRFAPTPTVVEPDPDAIAGAARVETRRDAP